MENASNFMLSPRGYKFTSLKIIRFSMFIASMFNIHIYLYIRMYIHICICILKDVIVCIYILSVI